ncbi:hypothetical protein EVAR_57858_1 [Eumeta japonica]|uniref:Endonuclease/exonuclease/phosphatase domain-containing protein n=1 Tax=Eumeta variegata TaxID=151549 RepID=A0A4C1ZGB8_EUMVA|nr:hypothetical protein EVAR_57858_1 [Eumeta japonica]
MIQANLQRSKVATADYSAGDRERDIDSLGSGTLCRKPRHPKTKSRHQSNTVHCRPPEASESGDNCFRRQSRENLIIAGDINAWSHWWEAREKTGGQAYRDFLDEMGFHILNTGSTPTFETYRAIESAVV